LATGRRNALPVAVGGSSLRTCPSLSSERSWRVTLGSGIPAHARTRVRPKPACKRNLAASDRLGDSDVLGSPASGALDRTHRSYPRQPAKRRTTVGNPRTALTGRRQPGDISRAQSRAQPALTGAGRLFECRRFGPRSAPWHGRDAALRCSSVLASTVTTAWRRRKGQSVRTGERCSRADGGAARPGAEAPHVRCASHQLRGLPEPLVASPAL
jgi:hypothetical protein